MKNFFLVLSLSLICITTSIFAQTGGISESKRKEIQNQIDELNKIIVQKGNKWVAGITSNSYKTDEQVKQQFGDYYKRSENDIRKLLEFKRDSVSIISNQRPLRKVSSSNSVQTIPNWQSFMSEVGNQQTGDCWAHATAGVTEGLLNYHYGQNINILISSDFMYQKNPGAGSPEIGFYYMNGGVPAKAGINSFPNFDNGYFRTSSFNNSRPTSIAIIKSQLQISPVYASMDVYHDFYYHYQGGVYRRVSSEFIGSHAVVIVGYNDIDSSWTCKNSWGSDWGINGYFKIFYGECAIDSRNSCSATVNSNGYANLVPGFYDLTTALQRDLAAFEYTYVFPGNYTVSSSPQKISPLSTVLIKSGATVDLGSNILTTLGNYYANNTGNIIVEAGGSIISSAVVKQITDDEIVAYYPSNIGGIIFDSNPQYYKDGYYLEVKSGSTVNISSNSTIDIRNGGFVKVLGTLNANAGGIKFEFNSPNSNTQNGIKFLSGSAGTLAGCAIRNAYAGILGDGVIPSISNCTITGNTFGVYLNNVGASSMQISDNIIMDNSSYGIYLYNSSPSINRNKLFRNGAYGVYCYQSSNPGMIGNTITSTSTGVRCSHYSSPVMAGYYLSGNNVVANNSSVGIACDYYSNPILGNRYGGLNSFFGNTYYNLEADYGCTINAESNWWGSYPPDTTKILKNQSSIDYTYYLSQDPNAGRQLGKIIAKNNAFGNPDAPIDSDINNATDLQMQGKYNEAIALYENVIHKTKSVIRNFALSMISECYKKLGKKNFLDYLDSNILPLVSNDDALSVGLLELKNSWLLTEGQYDNALKNVQKIKSAYILNEQAFKHALFNEGYINLKFLKNSDKAKEAFAQLAKQYANDPLVYDSKILVGQALGNTELNMTNRDGNNGNKVSKINDAKNISLLSNYPNPFNPSTTITYAIPRPALVNIKVYDIMGREVATLVNEFKNQGRYTITFEAGNLMSGVYLYRIQAGDYTAIKKMQVLK